MGVRWPPRPKEADQEENRGGKGKRQTVGPHTTIIGTTTGTGHGSQNSVGRQRGEWDVQQGVVEGQGDDQLQDINHPNHNSTGLEQPTEPRQGRAGTSGEGDERGEGEGDHEENHGIRNRGGRIP